MQQERGAHRRRLEAVALERWGAKARARPEVRAVCDTDDREAVELGCVRQVLEKGQGVAAGDRELHGAHTGERLETVEIRVERDARVPEDGDRDAAGVDSPPLLCPEGRSVIQVTRLEAGRAHAPLPPSDGDHEERCDGHEDPRPGACRDIAYRHRLRDARPVGSREAYEARTRDGDVRTGNR